MITGTYRTGKSPEKVSDRLQLLLAAANCEVVQRSTNRVVFKHGSMFTQTLSMLPKVITINVLRNGEETYLNWTVETNKFISGIYLVWAVVFCWLIFPVYLHHAVNIIYPKSFIENLLAGIG